MFVIVLLVGVPCSGKTTFANNFSTYISKQFKTIVVSYDEICSTFSSQERRNALDTVRKMIPDKDLEVCIIDDNNYYKSMRHEYVLLCKEFHLGFVQIYFDVDLEVALQRNSNRIEPLPENILRDMFAKIEIPKESTFSLHFKTLNLLKESDFDSILEIIRKAIANPEILNAPKEKLSQSPSDLQIIDIALRKIVGVKVKEQPSKAKVFNIVKKVLYKNIKCGNISVKVDNELENYLLRFFKLY